MSASSRPTPPYWLIERADGARVSRLLSQLCDLRDQGWDVTALLCPDNTVVGLGTGPTPVDYPSQLSLFAEASGV